MQFGWSCTSRSWPEWKCANNRYLQARHHEESKSEHFRDDSSGGCLNRLCFPIKSLDCHSPHQFETTFSSFLLFIQVVPILESQNISPFLSCFNSINPTHPLKFLLSPESPPPLPPKVFVNS